MVTVLYENYCSACYVLGMLVVYIHWMIPFSWQALLDNPAFYPSLDNEQHWPGPGSAAEEVGPTLPPHLSWATLFSAWQLSAPALLPQGPSVSWCFCWYQGPQFWHCFLHVQVPPALIPNSSCCFMLCLCGYSLYDIGYKTRSTRWRWRGGKLPETVLMNQATQICWYASRCIRSLFENLFLALHPWSIDSTSCVCACWQLNHSLSRHLCLLHQND